MSNIPFTPFRRLLRIFAGIYMETGFYAFDTITDPPVQDQGAAVNYNSAISGILAEADPDQGAVTVDPLETGDAILSGEDLPSGFRSRSFLFWPGVNSSGFTAKHEAMTKVHPSVFAGKLRMLVQALYGSRRLDIVYAGGISNMPILSWQGETLNPIARGAVHTGLLTTANYDYFLMQVGGGSANFTKLEFSAAGNEIVDLLRADAFSAAGGLSSTKTRAEAFLLSTATLSTDPADYHEITFTAPDGFIPWYGWQWNWAGNEGEAVTHQWEDTGSTHYIVARHYRLTVSAILTEDVYSFSIVPTIVEEANWHRGHTKFALLRPFPIENKLVNDMFLSLYPTEEINPPDTDENYNAPVYCFRDSNEDLQVCRVTQNLSYRTDTENISTPWGVFPNDLRWSENIVHNGLHGTISISCGNINYSSDFRQTSYENALDNVVVSIPPLTSPGSRTMSKTASPALNPHASGGTLIDYVLDSGMFNNLSSSAQGKQAGEYTIPGTSTKVNLYYGVRFNSGTKYAYSTKDEFGRTNRGHVSLVIPYDSCSSVLLAKQQYHSPRTIKNGIAGPFGTTLGSQGQFIIGYFNPYNSGAWTLHSVVSDMTGLMYAGGPSSASYDETIENVSEQYSTVMDALIDTQQVNVGSTVVDVYDYFHFGLDDPYVETPDFVKNSITLGYHYKTGYIGWGGSGIYNDFPASVSVGFA